MATDRDNPQQAGLRPPRRRSVNRGPAEREPARVPPVPSLVPEPGDIVWCNFPWHSGAAKYARPCLVLAKLDVLSATGAVTGTKLKLVYGTTAHLDHRYPGDFLVTKDTSADFTRSGLGGTTRFCFSRVADLDFTPQLFPRSPRVSGVSGDGRVVGNSCVMGLLPASLMPVLLSARDEYADYYHRKASHDDALAEPIHPARRPSP